MFYLLQGDSQMVGAYTSDPDSVLHSADVSSLRASVQSLENRVSTLEFEMRVFSIHTHVETPGSCVVETSFDGQGPQLLTQACIPVKETADLSQTEDLIMGQSADAAPSANRLLEQRVEQLESTVEQLESTISSYDERLKSLTYSSMQHVESACE